MKAKTRDIVMAGLLSNVTVEDTASVTGISKSTIYRYLNNDAFKAEYEERQREMMRDSCKALQNSIKKSINELVRVRDDETTSPQIKLKAIDMILRHSYRMTEQFDILERLDRLEHEYRG